MTPIDLGLLWLVMWICKTAIEDVSHAVKGTTNPRYELKAAKARAAGQAVPTQPRYGSRDWFADLLSDGLQAQTQRRRERAETKRATREQEKQDRQRQQQDGTAADTGDDADRGAGRGAEPPREPGTGRSGPDRDGSSQPGSTSPDPQPGGGTSGPGPQPGDPGRAGSGQPDPQDAPAETATVEDTVELPRGRPQPAGSSRDSEPGAGGAPGPDAPPHHSRQPQGDGPTATVIPFPNRNRTEENDVATEVIGLDQSIGYANSLAEFGGQHGSAGNEGYIGHLQASKVSGEALQSAHEMQAAFDAAAAASEKHAAELEKQRAVQEQYDANPDAGDKDYQQEGR